MKPYSILIGTPCRDMVHAGFAFDLAALIGFTPNVSYGTDFGATILANARNSLAEVALGSHATHVLFIDSDMRFPPDALLRLLEHRKPIIGANYLQRAMRCPTACVGGTPVSSKDRTGLERVDTIGMGCTLIDCQVFKTLPKPWFMLPYVRETHVSEDVSFCNRAREHGLEVWIDHDLSQLVKHTAMVDLGFADSE